MPRRPGASQLSEYQKGQLITLKNNGLSNRAVAAQLGCDQKTVRNWWQRFLDEGNVKCKDRSGAPKKTDARQDRELVRQARLHPFTPVRTLRNEMGLVVSLSTVKRRLTHAGLHGCIAAKKDKLTEAQKLSRYNFAREHLNWTVEQWRQVAFTDEKTFVVGHNGEVFVRCPRGLRLAPDYIKIEQRSGRFSISVWAWMNDRGNGRVLRIMGRFNQDQYLAILENQMVMIRQSFPDGFIYQQDRSPIHTARRVNQWLVEQGVERLDWPSKGCDMSPIENAWAMVQRDVDFTNVNNQDELWGAVEEAWQRLRDDQQYWEALVVSLPDRMRAVVESRGEWTRY